MRPQESRGNWPPHVEEVRPWRQRTTRGPRSDRVVREITVSLPPTIADLHFPADRSTAARASASAGDLSNLDLVHGRTLQALNHMLLRTESVASSKIENLEADLTDYGRAVLGLRASSTGVAVASATAALGQMITEADTERTIGPAGLLKAHHELFRRNPDQQHQAGKFRTVQNWIGGSDYAPTGALYVPPPPETVDAYLADLFAFANRTDLPAVIQAAIVHAQFESIHPFVDGNGRIGRALIHSVLRRRRISRHLTPPIASALVGNRARYFDALKDYRQGDAGTLIEMLATAIHTATAASWQAAEKLVSVRDQWHQTVSDAGSGSPQFRLLDLLTEYPFVHVDLVADLLGFDHATATASIDRLEHAGILTRLPRSRRTPAWTAREVLDEVRDLDIRIHQASRHQASDVPASPGRGLRAALKLG